MLWSSAACFSGDEELMKTSICQGKKAKEQQEHPMFQTTLAPVAAQSITKPSLIQYLAWVRVLHVRLRTVRNAALQHLLHTDHQEDLHVWVSHRENPLQQTDSGLSESRTPRSHRWVWPLPPCCPSHSPRRPCSGCCCTWAMGARVA